MSDDLPYQLRELQRKYKEALIELEQKDGELEMLREATEAAAELQSQDLQGAKIIELSKKNRALNLAYEREKAKVAQLEKDGGTRPGGGGGGGGGGGVNAEAVEDIARGLVEQAAEAAAAAQKEANQWKERSVQQTNKLSQLEQKAFSLEIEKKKLERALQREVGEDVPLAKVLEEGSDWKGRREQIVSLRDQIRQLKAVQGLGAGETRQEAVARKGIEKASSTRNAEAERLTAELASVRQEYESLKFKYDGAISRRKVLENEVSGMKEKMLMVLEKTQNDDRLITALKNEVANLKKQHIQNQSPIKPQGVVDDEIWAELSTLRKRCAEQEKQVDRQEAIILSLNQQLQQLNIR